MNLGSDQISDLLIDIIHQKKLIQEFFK